MYSSDCPCKDGHGEGQTAPFYPKRLQGKCVARDTLETLKKITSKDVFAKLAWRN